MKSCKMKTLAAMLALIGLIAGCVPNISPDQTAAVNANQVQHVIQGVVISMRVVKVSGDADGVGTLAGGAAGAVAGSALGGGDRMHLLGGIGGAVVGGLLGDLAQQKLSNQTGIEYIVKTKSGKVLSITQSVGSPLAIGQKVYVIMGEHARVIPAN